MPWFLPCASLRRSYCILVCHGSSRVPNISLRHSYTGVPWFSLVPNILLECSCSGVPWSLSCAKFFTETLFYWCNIFPLLTKHFPEMFLYFFCEDKIKSMKISYCRFVGAEHAAFFWSWTLMGVFYVVAGRVCCEEMLLSWCTIVHSSSPVPNIPLWCSYTGVPWFFSSWSRRASWGWRRERGSTSTRSKLE